MKLSKKRNTGFQLIPEGEHILEITKVEDKSKFGKMEVTLKTQNGLTTISRYNIENEKGFEFFSSLIRTAVKDYDSDEIKVQTAVGKFVVANVKHTTSESKSDPSRTYTNVNVYVKGESDGWEEDYLEVDEEDEEDTDSIFGEE